MFAHRQIKHIAQRHIKRNWETDMKQIQTVSTQINKYNQPRGQGMTEYIIIVSLVAIGSIGAITLFSDNLRRTIGMMSDAIAGDTNVGQRSTPGMGADEKITNKNMTTFGQNY